MRAHTVRAKVSEETKREAEVVLARIGLSMSDAINLMLIQVKMQQGLPFELTLSKVPNQETLKAIKETEEGKGLVRCKDADDLFDQLGI